MVFKQKNPPAIQGIILTSLLTFLAGCGNSSALEGLVRADPKLTGTKPEQPSSQTNSGRDSLATDPQSEAESSDVNQVNVNQVNKVVSKEQQTEANPVNQTPSADAKVEDLLLNFPVYPQAQLQETKSDEENNSGLMVWHTADNRQAVADYYQAELLVNDWEIIKPFTINPQQKIARAIAIKDQLRIELTILKSASQKQSERQNTQLALSYRPASQDAPSSISQAIESADATESIATRANPLEQKPDTENTENIENIEPPQKIQDEFQSEYPELNQPESFNTSEANNNYFASSNEDFADLDEVPEQLQQPLESVAALSILTPYTGKENVELSKFAPNEVVTRGEYARWLITANNRYYSDNPGNKIYIAAKTKQSAFKDVKQNHPDFEAIQSLAEAGLIPSRLTEDSTNLLFRPNAPLTRENLITWKVPLDTRQSLPQASIKALEESWGFQDAADINSSAIRAAYEDFQNGDRSNIRRIFGYTTLFQPKKPVTRAEAAASLSYFGFQGDGITAKEVLESEAEEDS